MNLVFLGSMMASEHPRQRSSIQRDVPRSLFQSVFAGSAHDGASHHAYAVSPDGQRFLIPQFESVDAGFGPAARASSPRPISHRDSPFRPWPPTAAPGSVSCVDRPRPSPS